MKNAEALSAVELAILRGAAADMLAWREATADGLPHGPARGTFRQRADAAMAGTVVVRAAAWLQGLALACPPIAACRAMRRLERRGLVRVLPGLRLAIVDPGASSGGGLASGNALGVR